MKYNKWTVCTYDKQNAEQLMKKIEISPLVAIILSEKGITTAEDAYSYLSEKGNTIDPTRIIDMDKAVSRIEKALESYEKIAIFGDYDADGVTSTALLYSYLQMQDANVMYYIPSRIDEGYGISKGAVDKFKEQGVSLIITVDNGISALDEADYIASLGIDLLVTDHHQVGDKLPRAVAVVNPHRDDCIIPFKEYAGVGVVYKLISALEGNNDYINDDYLDLVAIGTIADVMPLEGENRKIVSDGIRLLQSSDRVGILKLMEKSGVEADKLTSKAAAFSLVPRINAAGRMGDAEIALKLLLSDDPEEAENLAVMLDEDNANRKNIEADILAKSEELIQEEGLLKDKVLVVCGESWHEGVIGIVSAKLTEKYGKPTVVLTSEGDKCKGSARSIPGFSLYDALTYCKDILQGFGGHTLAAGMSLEKCNVGAFREKINDYAKTHFDSVTGRELKITCKLNPDTLGLDTINGMEYLEPFGAGNEEPVFGLYNMEIKEITPLSGGKHVKITAMRKSQRLGLLLFGVTIDELGYKIGSKVDVACTLSKNVYNGKENLSLICKDIRPSGFDEDEYMNAVFIHDQLEKGLKIDVTGIVPSKKEIIPVYLSLKEMCKSENTRISLPVLATNLKMQKVSPEKTLLALDILSDVGIISVTYVGLSAIVTVNQLKQKANLEDSETLKKLKEML